MISINELNEYLKQQEIFINPEQSKQGLYEEKVLRSLMLDLEDLIYRNMRKVSHDDGLYEIKMKLYENILNEIITTLDSLLDKKFWSGEQYNKEYESMLSIVAHKIDTIALKLHRYLVIYKNKDIGDIIDLIKPTAMYNYLMRDVNLELVGSCDLFEIINGRYFPVIKTNKLPDNINYKDEIALTGIAMLIEQEFDTEVFAGYLELNQTSERKTVIIDSQHRKAFFKELYHLKEEREHNVDEIVEEEA
jgi:CRISPR-associated exonuclease Cas4